jgi:predicted Zn-dependent protease
LESRVVPYATTGNAWPHPNLVSISFVPDGTQMAAAVGGPITSNLFSVFNAKFGSAAVWQNQILKAAQVWAQQTNINFTVVSDNGNSEGSGNYQQGDPGFGDIRIGGYSFGSSTLAWANQPPPVNNYSIAGDIDFNTSQTFNLGSAYDLFTVAAHEFGHALGLDESTYGNAVMYGSYTSAKPYLNADDIAGIRQIYSGGAPRTQDAGTNGSFAGATNINSSIDPLALTATVTGLDVTTTSDVDYYTFTAPLLTLATMTVQVQSSGLSLLAPKLSVYDANQTLLGTVSSTSKTGATLSITSLPVLAGQQFYVKVQGADTTAFGTGAYALSLSFSLLPAPTVASPNTQTPNGNPLMGGGGSAEESPANVVADVSNGTTGLPTEVVSALPTVGTRGTGTGSSNTLSALPPVLLPANGLPPALAEAAAGDTARLPGVANGGLNPPAAIQPPAGPRDAQRGPAPGQGEGTAPDLQLPVEALPAEALPALNAEQAGPPVVAPALPEAAISAVHAGTDSGEDFSEANPGRGQFFTSEPGDGMVALAEFATADAGLGLGRTLLFTVGGFALIPVAGRADRRVRREWLRRESFEC